MYRTASWVTYQVGKRAGAAACCARRVRATVALAELFVDCAGNGFVLRDGGLHHEYAPSFPRAVQARAGARAALFLAEASYARAYDALLRARAISKATHVTGGDLCDVYAWKGALMEHGIADAERKSVIRADILAKSAVRDVLDGLRGDDGRLPSAIALRVRHQLYANHVAARRK